MELPAYPDVGCGSRVALEFVEVCYAVVGYSIWTDLLQVFRSAHDRNG